MVHAYWEIGKHIVEEQGGKERAEYGNFFINNLSKSVILASAGDSTFEMG